MNLRTTRLLAAAALATTSAFAQSPDMLVTYSQPERTLSGSNGTVLQWLEPNEIAHLEWSNGPCSSLSAEKWAPRTCFHTMAGDENSDGVFWNGSIFTAIDALMVGMSAAGSVYDANPRTVFWSPSVDMGTGVSGAPGLRAGDVGRIIRNTAWQDGQVEHFMTREQFNKALGMPLKTVIDVDAIAWAPGMGVYFSLDQDILANPDCGATLIRDGDIICVPEPLLTYTPDMRIATVTTSCAHVIYTEAQVDAMVVNAGVTDRFGNCIPNAVDLESLEIDLQTSAGFVPGCMGIIVAKPEFIFSTETMTGAGLLHTAGGLGAIWGGVCTPAATPCGSGPTLGWQMGINPTNSALGAPSYVNAIAFVRSVRYSMEPQIHVQVNPLGGLPAGWQNVDISSPFAWNFILWTPAPTGINAVAQSFGPIGPLCFPDCYLVPSFYMAVPTIGGTATWPMLAIPAGFTGNVIFQSLAFATSGLELSTPMTLEIQ